MGNKFAEKLAGTTGTTAGAFTKAGIEVVEEAVVDEAGGAAAKAVGKAAKVTARAAASAPDVGASRNTAAATVFDVAPHKQQISPRKPLASHHGIQKRDLEENVPGYDADEAPTILLEEEPHAQITSEQASRRAERRAVTGSSYSDNYGEKRAEAIEQMRNAGVPESKIMEWVLEHDGYMFSLGTGR